MKIKELEEKVELTSLIAEEHRLERAGKALRVNPCPICKGRDHFTVYPETNSYASFSECCQGGGAYKYLMEVKEMDGQGAYKELCRLAGEEVQDMDYSIKIENAPSQPAEVKEHENLISMIPQLYHNQSREDKNYFLDERGLSSVIVSKYQLSVYEPQPGQKVAVMPVYEGGEIVSYVTRTIEGEKQFKNAPGGVRLFNIDHLKEPSDEPIIIVESVIDALTLEGRGIKSIALNGVQNTDKLKDAVIRYKAQGRLLLTAFDNDDAGRQATEKLGYTSIEIPSEYKDINDWNVAEIEAHKKGEPIPSMQNSLKRQVEQGKQPDASIHYLMHSFNDDIENMKQYKEKSTGFANLDAELGGVYPGLNVLGAITGGGKTTFTLQLADNMAQLGDHVLFFSLEQSKMELISKSIARTTAENNINDAVASIAIRSGRKGASIERAISDYSDTAERMNIIEGNFNTNAKTIREYVERYMEVNGVTPVVIVDYLQIMPAPDERMNDKQRMDYNVTTLKRMSRDLNITVFAISSLNRGNYLAPIDFESFKESGGIEYTADMILGLQLETIHSEVFDKKDKVKEKREKVEEAMKSTPRQIELVCLKNRNGNARFKCSYDYWPKYDYFEENQTGYKMNFDTSKKKSNLFPDEKKDFSHTYTEKDLGNGVYKIIDK